MNRPTRLIVWTTLITMIGMYFLWPEASVTGTGHARTVMTILPNQVNMAPDTIDSTFSIQSVQLASRPSGSTPSDTPSEDKSAALEEVILRFKHSLSQQEQFSAWTDAQWTKHPLGPGIRGWIIIMEKDQQELGYMVIYPSDDHNYVLGEYGTGTYPLFSMNTLYHSLIRQELIDHHMTYSAFIQATDLEQSRLYIDALYSFWRIKLNGKNHYFDAKTGEQWLITDEQVQLLLNNEQALSHELLSGNSHITQPTFTYESPIFDPFEDISWLVKTPLPLQKLHSFKQTLEHHTPLVYAARLFEQQLLKPYAVTGIQVWKESMTYLSLEEDGLRYIPMVTAIQHGQFYH